MEGSILELLAGHESLQRQTAKAASYWRLTDAGRRELARRRSR
jgi:DNA-binding PadR family transcriptional regulator